MAEPAALLGTVPMLYLGGDRYDIAGLQALGRLACLLIPALAVYTDQQLTAALGGVVDMPVVPAAGFKSDVGNENGLCGIRQRIEIAFADEILGVACVLLTKTEEAAMLLRLADISVDFLNSGRASRR